MEPYNEFAEIYTRVGVLRLGYEYQDLIALDILIDWIEHPTRYKWVRVEADEAGYLDDVVALKQNGHLLVKQVKFSAHPELATDPWAWDDLLHQRTSKAGNLLPSLLQKWVASFQDLSENWEIDEAAVVSNRRAAPDLQRSLSSDGLCHFENLTPEMQRSILQQVGNEAKVSAFFAKFRFHLNEPNLESLEQGLQRRFYRLGGIDRGWLNLKDALRQWVCHRDLPPPDGKITLKDIRIAALWFRLSDLPQQFEVPTDYVLPSELFQNNIFYRLRKQSSDCIVIYGSPGAGKSTYASYLYQELRKLDIPVVRHHYFLSMTDRYSVERLESMRAAESLMHDLEKNYSDALGEVSSANPTPSPAHLREWLEKSGAYFAAQNRALVVIIDGLDHVWRERRSVVELQRLLNPIIPPPLGIILVIATQPVDDEKLPSHLRHHVPRDQWLLLPTLNRQAIRDWLHHHHEVFDHAYWTQNEIPEHILDEITEALYSKSSGHPLYLRYVLKAFQEQNVRLSVLAIDRLPGCPHNDIVAYYRELWNGLGDEGSRAILHLTTACQFSWPEKGLLDCLDPDGTRRSLLVNDLSQVKHLLVHDDLGWRAFHNSLLVYIEGLPEHANYAELYKRKALKWLQTNAPNHLGWSNEWLLESEVGNCLPLLEGVTRQWAIEALAEARSRQDIRKILATSLHCALQRGELVRAFDISLVHEYTLFYNTDELDSNVLNILLYPQLLVEDDPYLRPRLHASLDELTDDKIACLAEANSFRDDTRNVHRCFEELRNRLARPHHISGYNVETFITSILQVAALPGGPEAEQTISFALRNRENGYTWEMLSIFSHYLWVYRNADHLRQVFTSFRANESEISPAEKKLFVNSAVLLALEQDLDFDDVICTGENGDLPFVVIYAKAKNADVFQPGTVAFPDTQVLLRKSYEHLENARDSWTFYYDCFFGLLANHLLERSEQNNQWLDKIGTHTWQRKFLHFMNTLAEEVSQSIMTHSSVQIGWFYERLKEVPRPTWTTNRDEYRHSVVATKALHRIALDILIIARPAGTRISISKQDLERAFSSGYCEPISWVRVYVDQRRTWLEEDAVLWLIEGEEKNLETTLDQLPNRAESYALLASLVGVHNLPSKTQQLIRKTADNLIAHGFHKDMLFFNVLEAIRVYHLACLEVGRPIAASTRWLLQIAPAIASVRLYTDGDETGNLPSELAEVLAVVNPPLLRVYYQWLARHEDFYHALDAFHLFLKNVDLLERIDLAIAQTAVDDQSLEILIEHANKGDERAATVIEELEKFLGSVSPQEGKEEIKSLSGEPLKTEGKVISPDDYRPDMLEEFIEALRSEHIFSTEEQIQSWIDYWLKNGDKDEVYRALQQAHERDVNIGDLDTLFNLAMSLYGKERAYPWLVEAHIQDYGWQRFFTRKEKALQRWQIIKDNYPDRWFDFLRDTLLGRTPWHHWYLNHNSFVRVVEYCLFMEQYELAEQLSEGLVTSSLLYISPLTLPQPEWTKAYDEASAH